MKDPTDEKPAPHWTWGAVFLLLQGFGAYACSTDGGSSGHRADTGAAGSAGGSGSAAHAGHGGAADGVSGAAGASSVSGTAGGVSGASGSGGASASIAGSASQAGSAGSGNGGAAAGCDSPGLVWKTARKTWYTSYPDPGSEECIKYNGCTWAGQFAACDDKKSEAWVSAHDIVAAFPDFGALRLHDLCLKSGNKTLVVTVLDTCGDDDCDGCCTQNKGDADELIDLESYTNARFGVEDGQINWADLGPTQGRGCD